MPWGGGKRVCKCPTTLAEKNRGAVGIGHDQIVMAIVVQIVVPRGNNKSPWLGPSLEINCGKKPAIPQSAVDRNMIRDPVGRGEI